MGSNASLNCRDGGPLDLDQDRNRKNASPPFGKAEALVYLSGAVVIAQP